MNSETINFFWQKKKKRIIAEGKYVEYDIWIKE